MPPACEWLVISDFTLAGEEHDNGLGVLLPDGVEVGFHVLALPGSLVADVCAALGAAGGEGSLVGLSSFKSLKDASHEESMVKSSDLRRVTVSLIYALGLVNPDVITGIISYAKQKIRERC